mmetsp:Transcript_12804/g.20886  ORF Transcript_12804/g.20886 Transcript_12804/m.20886 type:complete len:668 (+) Transcript_12804:129-2132(+)
MYGSDEEEDDGLTDYERTCNLIEEKKRLLVERKKRYSELTTAQYNTNQEYIRMQKALKNQTASINAATKRYVDHNVKLALAEADCAYFDSSRKSHGVGFDQKQELADIGMSRELLQDKLNEHRDLKARIHEEGNKSALQNQSLRQECLNVGFYCEDIRTKVEADIRKSLDRHHFDPDNTTKQHMRNTNKSAMTVANRVLDCREEVIGFFKQQLMKVKREERIAQEEKELMAERNTLKVNSEAHTESEMDSFVKKQNIIPSNDENADENVEDGDTKRRQPHPPPKEAPSAALLHLANSVKGRGNFVAGTARQKRKERNSPFAAINIDRIGDDLVRGCETEGNTCKLRALKAAMQNHILVQLSFILMMESELNSEKLVTEEARSKTSEGEILVSSASGSRGGSRAEGAGSSGTDAKRGASANVSKKQKSGGEFGQNMGKLLGLTSANIAHDENFVRYTKDYVNALKIEVAEVESTLLETSATHEEVLYHTCVDGIDKPWDASAILRPNTDDIPDKVNISASVCTDKSMEFDRKVGAGYRAQTMVALQNRAPLFPERTKKSASDKESKDEKTFGLAKWLDDGIFERQLSDILTAEVKSMNDIPIELGLAKVTSIGIATQQAASAQVKEFKERERRTMNLALTNPSAAAAAITNQSAPVEKKVLIKGLEAL